MKRAPLLICRAGLTMVLLFLTAGSVQAGVEAQGEIITTDKPAKEFKGLVRWNATKKVYIVKTLSGATAIEFEVAGTSVKSLAVAEPADIRQAVQSVRDNKLPQAIVALDKLAQDYLMLQWDMVATRWLAEAYIRDGKPDLAVRACERVTDKRPDAAISGEMAPWYWQALLSAGRFNKLEDLLVFAAKSPMPDGQARANIIRGELLRKQGKSKEALREGYLRTVVLFKGWRDPAVRDARAEALFKAAQCFDDLGQISPATRMRTICMNEHADSRWSGKLKAGDR
ncbi:MAG: tetratricopeptide repeat protein [Kiritimatiellia bacterium]